MLCREVYQKVGLKQLQTVECVFMFDTSQTLFNTAMICDVREKTNVSLIKLERKKLENFWIPSPWHSWDSSPWRVSNFACSRGPWPTWYTISVQVFLTPLRLKLSYWNPRNSDPPTVMADPRVGENSLTVSPAFLLGVTMEVEIETFEQPSGNYACIYMSFNIKWHINT